MLAHRFQRSTMAPGELFVARVSVVDDDHKSMLDARRHAIHELLRSQIYFDAFPRFGMDGISIKKFQFFRRSFCPGFDEATIARVDAQGPFRADYFDRQRIEKFVGK